MSNGVVLSASMRSNLLSLKNTQSLMDKTQNILATGKKINSPLDGAGEYFTASSLENRASDLSSLVDSMGQAIQTIKTADEGIKSITTLVQNAKAQANTASTDKSSTYNAKGTIDFTNIATAGPTGDGKFDVTIDGTVESVDLSAATSLADVATALNTAFDSATGTTGALVADVDATTGKLTITATDGKSHTVSGNLDGLDISGTADNSIIAAAEKNFNEILSQIDQLAADANYNGVNLLTGDDLKVIFNEDRSSSLTVAGVDASTAGLGLEQGDFSTADGMATAISQVDNAINSLRSMASDFSNSYSIVQNRQDFTENLMNILTDGADLLTLADMNTETAKMLALQVRQQLGVQALSISASAMSAVTQIL